MRRLGLTLPWLASLALGAGCVMTQRAPVAPIPVQFSAATPFRAHVPATDSTLATSCLLTWATGEVDEVRGDTIILRALRALERPRGASDCTQGRPARLIVSESPQLRTVMVQPNRGTTAFFVVVVMLGAALGALLMMLQGS